MDDDFTEEVDTPQTFDKSYDVGRVPQRDLTDFILSRGSENVSICELERPSPTGEPIRARGRVVNKSNALQVQTAPLTEWCIEYGVEPSLWIRSANVWYKLLRPAREYNKTHELARRRFEICARIFILCTTENADSGFNTIASLLACPWRDMRGYSERDILTEREFILAQIKNLNDSALNNCPFVSELRSKKPGSWRKVRKTAPPTAAGPWVPRMGLDAAANAKLMKKAEKTLREIMKSKNAYPFKEPVHPINHGCPDYLERIREPMDYGTIKANIDRGMYSNAFEIVKHVRLVASNCREYNTPEHEFAIWATEFENKMESAMKHAENAEYAAFLKRTGGTSDGGTNGSSGSNSVKKRVRVDGNDSSEPKISRAANDSAGSCSGKNCNRPPREGSKYCSDACGLAIARERIREMKAAGIDVQAFLRSKVTKQLVLSRNQ